MLDRKVLSVYELVFYKEHPSIGLLIAVLALSIIWIVLHEFAVF
jgi:hypothetical protein